MITSPEQIATGFAAAWNAADAGLLSELFTEDADFVNVVGLWWNTRSQIRDNHAYGFRHMFPHTLMTLGKVVSRQLGPDVAVVHTAWTLTGQITPPAKQPVTGPWCSASPSLAKTTATGLLSAPKTPTGFPMPRPMWQSAAP
jgi:uncharacterized protein (TIGR02246 family)